ncbi:hypothetical protein BT63DRAFT_418372 [Microthyrium microscopicum]|uniref:Zn(2)-C6 fungal-type domain-containing protein n=1 Tax=Microthyrium microscopicum TaxID=703497 RepID=A0A6A6TXT4_9PEZI|nr:hypothetical protein BT63DRAFT_418372 [Microthyrium microscopicum]
MQKASSPSSQLPKSQRILACVLCQQRKVKCDRRFPCANCTKAGAKCVQATLAPRGRRRRFPERDLLQRLRHYEELLRDHNIKFEPLHKDTNDEKESPRGNEGSNSQEEQAGSRKIITLSRPRDAPPEMVYKAKSLWHAMSQQSREADSDSDSQDDIPEFIVRRAWEQFENNGHLLLGSRNTVIDLVSIHPDPIQVLRLWQVFLDNVNPLIKVVHAPSLQASLIEAASHLNSIDPVQEALMFGIYCVAILSLTSEDCQKMFGSSQQDLLARYQFGCSEGLLNCGFLRSSDRHCLTALYLYLISMRPTTDSNSVASLLGIAIRLAQRMGINNEFALTKCTPIEAEMRRRLWWSLVFFDTRICEMASAKTATLTPTWECRIPLNVNDSDLRAEIKELPVVHEQPTDALFVVVRSELGNFVRHADFHLVFNGPVLKPIAEKANRGLSPETKDLAFLEKTIEEKYLNLCDPDIPLHFMTIWNTRAYMAKCRLLDHYSRCSNSSVRQTDEVRDTAFSYAIRILECDTIMITSNLIKGFRWMLNLHFPFPAIMHIAQDLKRRPLRAHADKAWEVLSNHYQTTRFAVLDARDWPFFGVFTTLILQAWDAREAACKQKGLTAESPRVVISIRQRIAEKDKITHASNVVPTSGSTGFEISQATSSMPMGNGNQPLLYSDVGAYTYMSYTNIDSGSFPQMPGQALFDMSPNQLYWAATDWTVANTAAGNVDTSTDSPVLY